MPPQVTKAASDVADLSRIGIYPTDQDAAVCNDLDLNATPQTEKSVEQKFAHAVRALPRAPTLNH